MFKDELVEYNKIYDKLYNIGLEEIEKLARQHLIDNPTLYEFYMGMGSYHFTTIEDEWTDQIPCEKLDKFMFDYNTEWKFTGSPMHFTAESETMTDW